MSFPITWIRQIMHRFIKHWWRPSMFDRAFHSSVSNFASLLINATVHSISRFHKRNEMSTCYCRHVIASLAVLLSLYAPGLGISWLLAVEINYANINMEFVSRFQEATSHPPDFTQTDPGTFTNRYNHPSIDETHYRDWLTHTKFER